MSLSLFAVGVLLIFTGVFKCADGWYYWIMPFVAIPVIYVAVFCFLTFVLGWEGGILFGWRGLQ